MHVLNDQTIVQLGTELLRRLPKTSTPYRKCALLGVEATDVHLVDVPLIAGVATPPERSSPDDLDVFLWLPILRDSSPVFVDLDDNRYTYKYRHWAEPDFTTIYYTFVYYKQDTHSRPPKNHLMDQIIDNTHPWFGDMLVIKSQDNMLCNVIVDDKKIICEILRNILNDGTVA